MAKLLLYVTKAKPYLADFKGEYQTYSNGKELDELWDRGFNLNDIMGILNGKIVAECDFEVEKIFYGKTNENRFLYPEPYIPYDYHTNSLTETQLCYKSKLNVNTLDEYLKEKNGYAIHIKNLHIFDEPRELSEYMVYDKSYDNMFGWAFEEEEKYKPVNRAPQNMMLVRDMEDRKYKILISIRPEWLCKILNGEKTIEVRKKVLKEMLNNE